jgi:hypothetical protein
MSEATGHGQAQPLKSYNYTKHNTQDIEPNKVDSSNETEERLKIYEKAEFGHCPVVSVCDTVRLPYKASERIRAKKISSTKVHTIESTLKSSSLHNVVGANRSWKLHKLEVSGTVRKPPELTKAQKKQPGRQEQIGKAKTNTQLKL